MIVVDSSVWIDRLRDRDTPQIRKLNAGRNFSDILVGDIILLEVLRGVSDEGRASRIERDLRQYPIVRMLDEKLAIKAAANYRFLRTLGITIRKSADLIIGTYCIEHEHSLLHNDRDFDQMVEHLGLRLA
jgi:predicted nucleic acid-binding protein